MSISKKIRLQSKEVLKNNWTPATAVLFVLLAAGFLVFSVIALVHYLLEYLSIDTAVIRLAEIITSVISLVCISPVFNGIVYFFYEFSKNKKADVSNAFFYIKGKKYCKTLLFNIYNSLYLVFIFIGLLILFLLYNKFNDIIPLYIINIIALVSIVSLIERTITISIKKITTYFLYADNSDEKFRYYRKASKDINKRHYWHIFKLFLSFLPWFALCFFVLPIFYVIPYAITSFATSEKWLIKLYKDGIMV